MLQGVMYTLDMPLDAIVKSYKHRFGYTPGWIAGPEANAHAVPNDTRRWLQEQCVTLCVCSDKEALGYWWAGTGKLP